MVSKNEKAYEMMESFVLDWNQEVMKILKEKYGRNFRKQATEDDYKETNNMVRQKMVQLVQQIDEWISKNSNYFVLDGYATSNFKTSTFLFFTKLMNFGNIVSLEEKTTNIRLEYNKKKNELTIATYRSDGHNKYKIIPVQNVEKDTLLKIIRNQFKTRSNEISEEQFGKPLSKLEKHELIALLSKAHDSMEKSMYN